MGGVVMKWVSLYVICLLMLVSCGGSSSRSTEVNVLCNPQEVLCKGLADEFTTKFGIKVNYVQLSAGESLTRLRGQKEQGEFDVWIGGAVDNFIVAKNEGLLEKYLSSNAVNLLDPEAYKDPDDFWTGIYLGTLVFGTNSEWLAAHPEIEPPHSWDDLLKPEFKGKVIIAHPATSGTSYNLLITILQLKGEVEGWNYFHALSNQIYQFTKSGTTTPKYVGQGDAVVCVAFAQAVIQEMEKNKLPLTITLPQEGTGYELAGIAMLKGAKHSDAAQLWIDWLLTPDGQNIYAKYHSYQDPTIKGVNVSHLELKDAKRINYDFIWSAEHKDEFVKKFTQEIATADNLLK